MKDNTRIGTILLKSSFNNDADADFLDILIASNNTIDYDDRDSLIQRTTIDHGLDYKSNSQFRNTNVSIFADPLADWKASVAKNIDL